jgi:hypothetical protein
MARTVRDTNLETRAARLRLQTRRKPYWRVWSPACTWVTAARKRAVDHG